MYEGHMHKAEGGRIEGGRCGSVEQGRVKVEKWRQLYLNNNKNNNNNK